MWGSYTNSDLTVWKSEIRFLPCIQVANQVDQLAGVLVQVPAVSSALNGQGKNHSAFGGSCLAAGGDGAAGGLGASSLTAPSLSPFSVAAAFSSSLNSDAAFWNDLTVLPRPRPNSGSFDGPNSTAPTTPITKSSGPPSPNKLILATCRWATPFPRPPTRNHRVEPARGARATLVFTELAAHALCAAV
eukprot:CAMPEP_0114300258 /NCGR_PEP_ID=MMETSP0059-20121206/13449_1 /TAXON_ID=36894 /ORGANISM="Pyramimonas parkeae, Strain CCMP726" /LENGTH=187 /DNA_ID=CAMNT_0001422861 /DNA_START=342 /DNA_END=906 /DNA_ORIENTATION=+